MPLVRWPWVALLRRALCVRLACRPPGKRLARDPRLSLLQSAAALAAVVETFRDSFGPTVVTSPHGRTPKEFAGFVGRGALPDDSVIRRPFFDESLHAFVGFPRRGVNGKPVARVPNIGDPSQVFPEAQLLSRVASALGKLGNQLPSEGRDSKVKLLVRNHLVHESPVQSLFGRNFIGREKHFARSSIPDDERQPLGRSPGIHQSYLRTHLHKDAVV